MIVLVICGITCLHARAQTQPVEPSLAELATLTQTFNQEVDHVLAVPALDQQGYALRLQQALADAQLHELPTQAFVVVDRSPQVQAAFVVVRLRNGAQHWVGAVAVSTGKPGRFEHFYTPLGVFPHTLDNPDFRAEGSFNKNHIRGYGLRGRRVFDFGWQVAERGWGKGGMSKMRFQMHATDPDVLEPRLGQVESEGCIRIPSTLNVFLDQHGLLDADYEAAIAEGKVLWVIRQRSVPIRWPGRYLVIVDSQATERPLWSPAPTLGQAPKTGPIPVKLPSRSAQMEAP